MTDSQREETNRLLQDRTLQVEVHQESLYPATVAQPDMCIQHELIDSELASMYRLHVERRRRFIQDADSIRISDAEGRTVQFLPCEGPQEVADTLETLLMRASR